MLESSPDARVIHYPADPSVKFWSFPSFEEWKGRTGQLKIESPASLSGKYADFEACPISLIQRSRATPPQGLNTEIVYAGEGKRPGDYRKAKGKIAICDSHCPREVYDAATAAGVAGIILYRHRPLPPLRKGAGVPGVRQYNSFWGEQKELFGFVLNPEDGQRLVSYLTSPAARKHPIKAWALVDSESYPGSLEVVTSLIPGQEKKEIVVVAHLCHPKPSAGDNASGVAALLETHRVLVDLIERGDLPVPRYGIRFLLVPEITGTFAYLSRERGARKRMLFGLNLDMVGQKQDVTGATLCIESPPLAASSFVPYLLEEALTRSFRQGANPSSTGDLVSIKLQPTPFSGGSDHFILSDPSVGVPTPMLIQWPDKYYHTSGDTPDKVSADTLRRVVAASGAYAYTLALASERDALWLAGLTGRGLRKRMIDEMARGAPGGKAAAADLKYRARVLQMTGRQALRSLMKLVPGSAPLKDRLDAEVKALRQCARQELSIVKSVQVGRKSVPGARARTPAKGRGKYANLVVKRLVPGPVDMHAVFMQMDRRVRARYAKRIAKESRAYMMQTLALYWADGRRSIAEICRLVGVELGYTNPGFIKFYFDLLKETGIVKYSRR
jgi:hypothetical protein